MPDPRPSLVPLSTDLYLPALPTLASVFATDAARVQLTLSVFLAGLLVYFLASLACVFASDIEMLIVARFVQALGACVGPLLGPTLGDFLPCCSAGV